MSNKTMPKLDCRYFRGDVPCKPGKLCEECEEYSAVKKRILVVLLGSMGDVLRSTPCLPKLRARYDPCHITWIVGADSFELLQHNPYIDRLVAYGSEANARTLVEEYDLAIGLDKDPCAASIVSMSKSFDKLGFALHPTGAITYFGESCEYAYRLGLDDELKFRENKKTYQEIIFEMMCLDWEMDDYILSLPENSAARGKHIVESSVGRGAGPIIGFSPGANPKRPHKKWTIDGYAALADKLVEEIDARIVIFGVPRDVDRNARIVERAASPIALVTHSMNILTFAGALSALDAMVGGDSVAAHIALAVRTPAVCVFGPTSAVEFETYNRCEKVVTPLECAPCYKSECRIKPDCMDAVDADDVFSAVKRALKKRIFRANDINK